VYFLRHSQSECVVRVYLSKRFSNTCSLSHLSLNLMILVHESTNYNKLWCCLLLGIPDFGSEKPDTLLNYWSHITDVWRIYEIWWLFDVLTTHCVSDVLCCSDIVYLWLGICYIPDCHAPWTSNMWIRSSHFLKYSISGNLMEIDWDGLSFVV
jgi:hypothetical protein